MINEKNPDMRLTNISGFLLTTYKEIHNMNENNQCQSKYYLHYFINIFTVFKEVIPMKFLILFLLSLTLAGCGHNALVFSSGKFLNLGVDPTTQKLGIQYVSGEQVTLVNRENTELKVELEDVLNADGKKTQRISKIEYKIGDQKNGYNK